jgi:hypothetical protein
LDVVGSNPITRPIPPFVIKTPIRPAAVPWTILLPFLVVLATTFRVRPTIDKKVTAAKPT